MALQSLTLTEHGWMPEHEPTEFCWCRPRAQEIEGGWLQIHRRLPVRPSPFDVCTASVLEGAPV